MKINQAVKIVENCRKSKSNQSLCCLMEINDKCKELYGEKLFTFFEMVSILGDTEEALSYVVSNIEQFTKIKSNGVGK